MTIPSGLLLYMLCYAWDRVEYLNAVHTAVKTAPDDLPQNLFARLLGDGCARLLRRGLDRAYREHSEDTRRPRGKVDLRATVQRALQLRGKVHVRVNELSVDVLHNRLLFTTLRRLARTEGVDGSLRRRLAVLTGRFAGVREIALEDSAFGQVVVHRQNAHYGFLMHLCRLLAGRLFPVSRSGGMRFRTFSGDDREMGLLFEGFVRGYLRVEHNALGATRSWLDWGSDSDVVRLPRMETDVHLRAGGGRSTIVETKCVSHPFADDRTLRPKHVNQLFAYLANHARVHPAEPPALGVLLYATFRRSLDSQHELNGHPFWVRSVDLAAPWREVRQGLDKLAADLAEQKGRGGARDDADEFGSAKGRIA